MTKKVAKINLYTDMVKHLKKAGYGVKDIVYVSQHQRMFHEPTNRFIANLEVDKIEWCFPYYKDLANKVWTLKQFNRPLTEEGLDLIIAVDICLNDGTVINHGPFFDQEKVNTVAVMYRKDSQEPVVIEL